MQHGDVIPLDICIREISRSFIYLPWSIPLAFMKLSNNSCWVNHYDDVIMSAIASQITSLTIVYSTVYPGADRSKHQSSASLAFVWGNHRGPVNSPHKWPVTRKIFPFDDVIMSCNVCHQGISSDNAEQHLITSLVPSYFMIMHLTISQSVNNIW